MGEDKKGSERETGWFQVGLKKLKETITKIISAIDYLKAEENRKKGKVET